MTFSVDIISAIEFDKTGEHLATGDRGGRVVLFERTDGKDLHSRKELERLDYPVSKHPEFRYKTEFQSHEPEFDYLKSLEIEEKINKIRWCPSANGALFLLSTNDKTVKFWKVQEKKVKKLCDMNVDSSAQPGNGSIVIDNAMVSQGAYASCSSNGGTSERTSSCHSNDYAFPPGGIPSLRLPAVASNETSLVARCRRVYAHAHDYHINSISNNSDGETFISADDLRINLWNLEISDQSFNIIDVKPANMEDLTVRLDAASYYTAGRILLWGSGITYDEYLKMWRCAEVITSAEFHPTQCNMLAYSSSKGTIRLIDMRQSALCDNHAKFFISPFWSSARLTVCKLLLSSGKLCDLYENDSIFDKFECCLSGDGLRVATGSYSNLFRVFGCVPGSDEATTLEASKSPNRRLVQTPSKPSRSLTSLTRVRNRRGNESPGAEMNGGAYDFSTKLLHLAWHPTANAIACAASNSLYMYYA